MFKGLKSKLEDEAKRLQATVTQYGENIAQQVRTGASENGSDISGYTRRLFSVNTPESAERKTSQNSNERLLLPLETIILLDDDDQIDTPTNQQTSALIKRFDDLDLPDDERVRRISNTSLESNESASISQSASATLRLESISSDVESNAGSAAESTSFECVPREQLSSIIHKLQRRTADSKRKYNEVARAYKEVMRENEKCRAVLASMQDKALQRISKLKAEKKDLLEMVRELEQRKNSEASTTTSDAKIQKLQELLEKCKERLSGNKIQIASLVEENNSLKNQIEDGGQDLSIEKVTAEWKGRVDRLEEEWSQRLASCDEKATIAIAMSKAEMHSTLQLKDQEIEKWISKCHGLEKQDADANQRWQRKVEELNRVIVNLESEKADMVEKLSQAKQEGVKLVKEEEEKKQEKMAVEFDENLAIELLKKDDEWRKKLKESEDQMQLAIEEREMQKAAALAAQERRFDELNIQIENLKTENIRLSSELSDPQRVKRNVESVDDENNVKEHRRQIVELEKRNAVLAEENVELMSKAGELKRHWENNSAQKKRYLEDALMAKANLDSRVAVLLEENAVLKIRETELSQRLESQQSDDQQILASSAAEREKLQAKIDSLNRKNTALEEAEKDLKKQLVNQKSIADEGMKRQHELQAKIVSATEEVELVKRRYDELEELQRCTEASLHENDNAMRRQVDDLNATNAENVRKIADFAAQIERMTAERRNIEENQASVLEKTNEESLSRVKELEAVNVSAIENVRESKAQIELLNERIATLRSLLEQNDATLANKQSRIAELTAIIDAHFVDEATADCEKCAEYAAKLSALSAENDANLKRCQKLESLYESTADSLRDSQAEAKASKEDLRKQLDDVVQEKNSKIAEIEETLKNASSDEIVLKNKEIEAQLNAGLIEKTTRESNAQTKRCAQLEKKHKFATTRQKELESLYNKARSNLQENEAKAESMRNAERDHIDALTQENSELLRRCDELEALSELSKPTELEYLRNVLYRYMTERETLGKEVVTLTKVIGTVVKFSADQLDLAVRTEENRYNSNTWYNGVQSMVQKTAAGAGGAYSSHNNGQDGFHGYS